MHKKTTFGLPPWSSIEMFGGSLADHFDWLDVETIETGLYLRQWTGWGGSCEKTHDLFSATVSELTIFFETVAETHEHIFAKFRKFHDLLNYLLQNAVVYVKPILAPPHLYVKASGLQTMNYTAIL